jgi:hypothetical protein
MVSGSIAEALQGEVQSSQASARMGNAGVVDCGWTALFPSTASMSLPLFRCLKYRSTPNLPVFTPTVEYCGKFRRVS